MYKLSSKIIFDTEKTTNKNYLMDIGNGRLFELNKSATILIKKIMEGKSIDDYIDEIMSYVPEGLCCNQVKEDAFAYLKQLIDKGFIIEDKNE